ncbi:ABC transporter ATP-binding protein [Pseudoramibacter faecis]|uniref:ABC transporter ATP-binding protein n=1 Tax=Pseudoramibacter faecis TaxID=3108534 RepID=UPI002E7A28B0|nr:ABC transporter ATP-binding protein [Pseudoramibacter sp. HA2172]
MDENSVKFNIGFKYSDDEKNTLNGVDGNIEKGRCICFHGESGCRKSTLLRCINHLIPEFYEGKFTGIVWVGGEDISTCSIGEVSKKVSSVFQDPRSQFFTVNSTTGVAFGLENTGLSHAEIVRKTDEVFRRFGLQKLRDRSVFTLSSGERQLIAIFSAMVMDTDTILLDEPAANLDTGQLSSFPDC